MYAAARRMGTPWDRAADGYLAEWVPRFTPYHQDLVRELVVHPGQKVLVTSAGPGVEVLAVARAVGEDGRVRATDASRRMSELCAQRVTEAGFDAVVTVAQADASDVGGATEAEGGWDAIVSGFGIWQIVEREYTFRAWKRALAPTGKIGVLTWGPSADDDPFEQLASAAHELAPEVDARRHAVAAGRESFARLFEGSGLSIVRHTHVAHTMSFPTAERFVAAMRESSTFRRVYEELGDVRFSQVAARFYDQVGGPEAPLTFAPVATLVLLAHAGAEVELAHRPSVLAPPSGKLP